MEQSGKFPFICLVCFGNRVSHSLDFPWFHCGAWSNPCFLASSSSCVWQDWMLGDVMRIPGAAVTPLLPLAYYSVILTLSATCQVQERHCWFCGCVSVIAFRVLLGHLDVRPIPKLVSSRRAETSSWFRLIRSSPLRLPRVQLHFMLLDTRSREKKGRECGSRLHRRFQKLKT